MRRAWFETFTLRMYFPLHGKGHVAMKDVLAEERKKAEGGGGRRVVLAKEGGRGGLRGGRER